MKNIKRKLIITAAIVGVLSGLVVFDVVLASLVNIDFVSLSPQIVPADGQTEVTVRVRVTDSAGKPLENHMLFAYPSGGMLKSSRERTGADGEAVFVYYPYRLTSQMPLTDVRLNVIDESNSVFFEINASGQVDIHLVEPENDQSKDDFDWNNAIFGQ